MSVCRVLGIDMALDDDEDSGETDGEKNDFIFFLICTHSRLNPNIDNDSALKLNFQFLAYG